MPLFVILTMQKLFDLAVAILIGTISNCELRSSRSDIRTYLVNVRVAALHIKFGPGRFDGVAGFFV